MAERAAQLRADIENTDSDWDREKLQERLAKLAGGVAVIKVGAATEIEAKERKHRIEDAVHATKAAVAEGIIARWRRRRWCMRRAELADLGQLTGDEATGVAIVRRAAGAAPVLDRGQRRATRELWWSTRSPSCRRARLRRRRRRLRRHGQGRHHRPGQGDQSAVVNAASIARMIISTESAIVDKPEQAPPAGQGQGHGHGHGPGM